MRQSPPAKRRKTSSIWFSGSDYFPFTSSKQRKILCYIFADLEATREYLPYNRAVCYKRTKKRTSQSLEILESGEWVKPRKKPRLRLRTERRHILRMVARVHGFRVKNMAPDLFTNSCSVKNILTRWIALPPPQSMCQRTTEKQFTVWIGLHVWAYITIVCEPHPRREQANFSQSSSSSSQMAAYPHSSTNVCSAAYQNVVMPPPLVKYNQVYIFFIWWCG